MTSKVKQLDPLRELLDGVITRIENLESHCGIGGGSSSSAPSMQKTPSSRHITSSESTPALKAYDGFLHSSVTPLADICDDLEGMDSTGKLLVQAFEGIRYIIVLASRSKFPSGELATELSPHMKGTNDAVKSIRALRLDRNFDNHQKAITEMLICVSWVYCKAPAQLPAPFVKEAIGASDFWSNRVRKEYKDKSQPKQIEFCDAVKKLLNELAKYIQEFHTTGLTFNPRGVSLAEAAVLLTDDPFKDAAAAAAGKSGGAVKRQSLIGKTVQGGNLVGLMSELSSRKNEDGSSAATGLKKVTKDQQTWRKEYKKEGAPAPKVVVKTAPVKTEKKKKPKGLPILEYQERGNKWVIENQTKETALKESETGVLIIEVADPKQQVYIFNCEEITVQVKGAKFKSIIVDNCVKVNCVFETIISGCEIVNSKKIAAQTSGVCPVFTIDKTSGVTVYLSEESAKVSTFTTSMSTEMNVSIPDGDDQKEMPIPEQFVHKINGGAVSSEVSDLYH